MVQEGKLAGVLTRTEAIAALSDNRSPTFEPPISCLPNQTVAQLQGLLIESSTLLVVLLDRPDGRVLGLITLHDLLRAETAAAKGGG